MRLDMKSSYEVKDHQENKPQIEDMLPECSFTSNNILDIGNIIIGSDGNPYSEAEFTEWLKDGDRQSPLNPDIQLSMEKKVPGNIIKNVIQDLVNAYKKLEIQKNALAAKVKRSGEIEIPALPCMETQNLSRLSQLIEQKTQEQTAAFIIKKRLIRNLLGKEKALRVEWDQFKNQWQLLKKQQQDHDQHYRIIMSEIVQTISPTLDISKKDSSFEQMAKMITEWKLIKQFYVNETQVLLGLRKTLIKKTLSSGYVLENKDSINNVADEFSKEIDKNDEEKQMQLEVPIKKFISKKFSERSYVERCARLNILMQKNAKELNQLRQERISVNVKLNIKFQDQQLNLPELFGGEKDALKEVQEFKRIPVQYGAHLQVPPRDNPQRKLNKNIEMKFFQQRHTSRRKLNESRLTRPPSYAPPDLNGGHRR
jgi:hypothetical protein